MYALTGGRRPSRRGAGRRTEGWAACGALLVIAALVAIWLTADRSTAGGPAHIGVALTIVIGAGAAAVDAATGRIPDVLVVAATVPMLALLAAGASDRGPTAVAMLAGACVFAGPFLVVHLVAPAALGFGDVKLAAVLGAALGVVEPVAGLLAVFVATGVTAAVGLVTGRRTVPLGPGLVLGTAAACTAIGPGGGLRPWW
jgi:leader peptidase (prepilin peptidase)/N-methyltransferase